MEKENIKISKEGLKFGVHAFKRPGDPETVWFTEQEFSWLKAQRLSSEEFRVIWNMKMENWNYDIIPQEKDIPEGLMLANKYVPEIIKEIGLKTKTSYEKDKI